MGLPGQTLGSRALGGWQPWLSIPSTHFMPDALPRQTLLGTSLQPQGQGIRASALTLGPPPAAPHARQGCCCGPHVHFPFSCNLPFWSLHLRLAEKLQHLTDEAQRGWRDSFHGRMGGIWSGHHPGWPLVALASYGARGCESVQGPFGLGEADAGSGQTPRGAGVGKDSLPGLWGQVAQADGSRDPKGETEVTEAPGPLPKDNEAL